MKKTKKKIAGGKTVLTATEIQFKNDSNLGFLFYFGQLASGGMLLHVERKNLKTVIFVFRTLLQGKPGCF